MCDSIVKYLLFFVNLIFWLGSVGLIAFALIIKFNFLQELIEKLPDLGDWKFDSVIIAVIVVACVIFVISFAGCCGAIRENRCLLVLYAVCMLILAAAKSYIAYLLLGSLVTLQDFITNVLKDTFNNNLEHFHAIESLYKCCGSNGVSDYTNNIPPTCCANPFENTCNTATEYYRGCSAVLNEALVSYGLTAGYIVIGIIVFEVVAMVAALYMNSKVTEKNRSRSYY